DGSFFIARASFLASALAEHALGAYSASKGLLGAWLGVAARRRGLRIAYSPHIVAQDIVPHPPSLQSDEETWAFLEENWPLLLDDPCYSRFCSLRAGHGWQLTSSQERAAVLNYTLSGLAGPLPYLAHIKLDGKSNRRQRNGRRENA